MSLPCCCGIVLTVETKFSRRVHPELRKEKAHSISASRACHLLQGGLRLWRLMRAVGKVQSRKFARMGLQQAGAPCLPSC